MYIKRLESLKKNDARLVGGKAASLGRLIQAKITVPNGFVITTKLSVKSKLTPEIINTILEQFDTLGAKRVAVRSSAIAEDSSSASWAGQLETYLNVNRGELIDRVKDCWNSINSKRVATYTKNKNIKQGDEAVAVIVQEMVDSEVAGVAFTVNPTNNNANEILIEAGWGLGESIVQGEITPEAIILDKKSLKTTNTTPLRQDKMLVYRHNKNIKITVPTSKQNRAVLSELQVKKLANLLLNVEKLYKNPVDVEWAYANRKLFILQARPITTLHARLTDNYLDKRGKPQIIAKGQTGSAGLATGLARVITSLDQLGKVKKDEILVSIKTTPDYVEVFTKVKGIVTDIGGATSHAAIISRELGIPAVVNTLNGTKTIKTGEIITVDGSTGEVYGGEVKRSALKDRERTYNIPKTGDEIDNLLNSMVGVFVDVRDLWPMPPINLFPYFDVDQALGTYQKLKQLVNSGMSLKEIARLFGRAEQVRYFLINTGVGSLKTAHNLKIADITIADQIKLVEWCVQVLKELTQEDPLCLEGKNIYWPQAQVDKFISDYSWQEMTDESKEVVNRLSINLYSMNWSFYWNYYGAAGYDIHGPYLPKKFKNSQLIVKDYFNPRPTELWPIAKKVPFKSAMLAQVYTDTNIAISFGNRLVNQEELGNRNSHFVLLVDGKQVTDLKIMQHLSHETVKVTRAQTEYVNSMERMDVARMCAKLAFYIHKDFYLYFGKEWYPEAEIEATIKFLGRKFIDQKMPKTDRTPEFRRQVLDPRNYITF